jgi:hypothetical protein
MRETSLESLGVSGSQLRNIGIVVVQEQAKANEVLSRAITPIFVSYKSIERWNGVLPPVAGGAIPFIGLRKMSGVLEAASTDKK